MADPGVVIALLEDPASIWVCHWLFWFLEESKTSGGKNWIPSDDKALTKGLVFILYLGDIWSLILPMKVIS